MCIFIHFSNRFLNLFVLPEDRNGEMFCYFVSFNLAYEYLEKIEPGTILVKTPLDTKKEPKILRDRIPKSDYREIISAISRFTKKTKFSSMRAKSMKKGFSIGLALSIPIAAVVGMASLGLGTPLSVLIVSACAGIGSACGAVNSKDLKKSFGDFNSYIENLNDTVLKEKGVFLVSPLVTNSFSNLFGISQSSARKISHVQWIVKTLDGDIGDPAVGSYHDPKEDGDDEDDDSSDDDDDDDDDDASNGLYGSSSDDSNSSCDDESYSYHSDDDQSHYHGLRRNKRHSVECNLSDLKSPESGSSTSSDSDDIPQSIEEIEETLFSFMNFDFIRDDSRKVMRLQRSKSSFFARNRDSKPLKRRKKKKDDRHSYPGIIVVTPDPFKNDDDDAGYDSEGCGSDFVRSKCLETLEVEDISSDNSSDDDVGYDDTKSFCGDYKLKVIRKWD